LVGLAQSPRLARLREGVLPSSVLGLGVCRPFEPTLPDRGFFIDGLE